VNQIKETKRPLVLTQNGISSAVLIDVAEYQAIIEKLELLQEVQLAEQQVSNGDYITDIQLKDRLKTKYKK
jgi:PHD/YefM family antitoxin component YafN of YafNO toxin-antitoxin module